MLSRILKSYPAVIREIEKNTRRWPFCGRHNVKVEALFLYKQKTKLWFCTFCIVLYILIFMSVHSRKEDKKPELRGSRNSSNLIPA